MWHNDGMTNPVMMELVFFGIRRDIVLVLSSNHFSSQQLTNYPTNHLLLPQHAYDQQPYVPVLQWTEYHYQADSQEVWRQLPIRTTGSHNKFGLLLMED